jgi:hypothetical protein
VSPLNKTGVQLYVAIGMIVLWAVGLLLIPWIGTEMVKLMTPLLTMMIGWLFTERATS